MTRFYQPDLGSEPDSPFARDAENKLMRRGFWLDMNDRSLVLAMTQGVGSHLTNDEKRAHLTDLKRERLIDQVCIQEILPPDKDLRITCKRRGISATPTSNVMALRQKERISDTN